MVGIFCIFLYFLVDKPPSQLSPSFQVFFLLSWLKKFRFLIIFENCNLHKNLSCFLKSSLNLVSNEKRFSKKSLFNKSLLLINESTLSNFHSKFLIGKFSIKIDLQISSWLSHSYLITLREISLRSSWLAKRNQAGNEVAGGCGWGAKTSSNRLNCSPQIHLSR